jgi:hypothetical protein
LAADVTEAGTSAPAAAAPKPPKPAKLRPYRHRFVVVYVALAAVLGGAVAGLVLALGGVSVGTSGPAWSPWKPSASGDEAKAKEIAEHIGRTYRLPNGDQLLDVIAKRPSFSNATTTIPVKYVVVHGVAGKSDEQTELSADKSQMFSLCGLGDSCAIATGTPTVARGRLVRREALELALYTFKYVGDIRYVIALMPPRRGTVPTYALYFNRSDFDQELSKPLSTTLAPKTPGVSTISPHELVTIDRLTEPHMFKFSVSPSQQGDLILVLSPAV